MWKMLSHFDFNRFPNFQFKQIAQAVHVRLPRTSEELAELPPPTTSAEIRESKIAEINQNENQNDITSNENDNTGTLQTGNLKEEEGDLV